MNARRTTTLLALIVSSAPTTVYAQSLSFQQGQSDYEIQQSVPPGFGNGEFTFEVSVRLDDSFPVGDCDGGQNQLRNWCADDPQPAVGGEWWFKGNFLLDGHNNFSYGNGTFSLQVYGGGRIRWLFGDGQLRPVQAWPATSTDSLLDGQWHKITLVRRYNASSAVLEMYIDGSLVATRDAVQTNMRQWWDDWSGFPAGQEGWFWGIEKQVSLGLNNQYEDFKGLLDNRKFFARAKTAEEITHEYDGLVGVMRHREGTGSLSCDSVTGICTQLTNMSWSAENAPETFATGSPPGGPRNVVTLDEPFNAYPWIDLSNWIRDTGAYAGNPGPTAYARNYFNFPQETASFSFSTPQVLESIDVATLHNGAFVITTDFETATFDTSANVPLTLRTGFTEPTSTVTIGYVGGNFGIDNIVSVEPE